MKLSLLYPETRSLDAVRDLDVIVAIATREQHPSTFAAWTAARALPPARWAGFEPAFFEQSARLWDGAGCVEGLDAGRMDPLAGEAVLRAPRLEHEHLVARVGAQPVGQRRAGRASSDDHVVVALSGSHQMSSQGRSGGRVGGVGQSMRILAAAATTSAPRASAERSPGNR